MQSFVSVLMHKIASSGFSCESWRSWCGVWWAAQWTDWGGPRRGPSGSEPRARRAADGRAARPAYRSGPAAGRRNGDNVCAADLPRAAA